MSESSKHIELVNQAFEYAKTVLPEGYHRMIQLDSPDSDMHPIMIDSFIPDLYYQVGEQLIIGEAKTENDFENKHTRMQINAYIHECNYYQDKGLLIISVPWQISATAGNYIRRLRRKGLLHCKVIVLNDAGKVMQV